MILTWPTQKKKTMIMTGGSEDEWSSEEALG
jgi:hypothetical protein